MSQARSFPVYTIHHCPPHFARRSGMGPLAEAVGAVAVSHGCFWKSGGRVHERFGEWLKEWGIRYYGSRWNQLIPVYDEIRVSRHIKKSEVSIAHFLFAEHAGPRRAEWFRRRGARIVGTFHAAPNKQHAVTDGVRLEVYDAISVVSETQRPYFLARGFPERRIHVTPHGVDTDYFRPDSDRPAVEPDRPLRGLLVGRTGRDHQFAAELLRALPRGMLHLHVATKPYPHKAYRGLESATLHPHLSDEDLLRHYQQADILVMPLKHATANNALLESMACGTPVLVNNLGGVAEYVDASCNYLLPSTSLDQWVDAIKSMHANRHELMRRRDPVRNWASTFSWPAVAPLYRDMYTSLVQR